LFIARCQHQFCAALGCSLCCCQTDAGSRAGDDHHLLIQRLVSMFHYGYPARKDTGCTMQPVSSGAAKRMPQERPARSGGCQIERLSAICTAFEKAAIFAADLIPGSISIPLLTSTA